MINIFIYLCTKLINYIIFIYFYFLFYLLPPFPGGDGLAVSPFSRWTYSPVYPGGDLRAPLPWTYTCEALLETGARDTGIIIIDIEIQRKQDYKIAPDRPKKKRERKKEKEFV